MEKQNINVAPQMDADTLWSFMKINMVNLQRNKTRVPWFQSASFSSILSQFIFKQSCAFTWGSFKSILTNYNHFQDVCSVLIGFSQSHFTTLMAKKTGLLVRHVCRGQFPHLWLSLTPCCPAATPNCYSHMHTGTFVVLTMWPLSVESAASVAFLQRKSS